MDDARIGADVAAVVEQVGIEDAVLVGHSMGGDVILEAALMLGRRVRGLVWVDTYRSLGGRPDSPDEIETFVAAFRRDFIGQTQLFVRSMFGPGADPDLVNWVAADMSAAPPEVALDSLKHAVSNEEHVLRFSRSCRFLPSRSIPTTARPMRHRCGGTASGRLSWTMSPISRCLRTHASSTVCWRRWLPTSGRACQRRGPSGSVRFA